MSASLVLVAGAGVSGRGALELLERSGRRAVMVDDNQVGEQVVTTAQALELLDDEVAAVVTSPGWRPDSPLLVEAARRGIDVIGDVQLAYDLDQNSSFGPPRTWLVVTGTNGKTTTTAMLAAMMKLHAEQAGLRASAVGNIGVAVAEGVLAKPRIDILVTELSSFQLHWSKDLVADAAVVLNLAEDHIDWHGSFDNYVADKLKALNATVAVANADDQRIAQELKKLPRQNVITFTRGVPKVGQVGVDAGLIVDNSEALHVEICPIDGIQPPGLAGVYDALAATAMARSQNVAPETIARALAGFVVDDHRGQIVHKGEKTWIDNSKATNPHAADAALSGFSSGVIWIAGGQLKGASIDELVRRHAAKFSAVAVLGEDRDQVAEAVAKYAPHATLFSTENTDGWAAMREIVEFCANQPGHAVVLAPAGASLDMFSGMAQRGDFFAEACAHVCEEETR